MNDKNPGQFKAGKTRPDVADKRLKALNLRRAGLSYEKIAQACGYHSAPSAYKAVKAAIADLLQEPAEEVLRLELERLDRLFATWFRRGIGKLADPDAADRALRIIRQRCELLGLNVMAVKRLDAPGESTNSLSDEMAAELLKMASERLKHELRPGHPGATSSPSAEDAD